MKYDRKKETDPLKTIEKARKILREQDILTTEIWKNGAKDAKSYSLRLSAPELGVGTNGKGVTRRYTLASAYGEFMERLSNMVLLPLESISAEDLNSEDFYYFPDEKIFTADEIADATDSLSKRIFREFYKGQFLLDINKEQRLAVVKAFLESAPNANESKLIAWPYYSVKSGETVYLWNRYVAFLQGTNGMCAGNSPEEAIVQGMSEIFERYSNQTIMLSDIVPPEIPEEEYRQYDDIAAMADEIEAMGDYKIYFRDCSLGKGLPVCCAILIDRSRQKYRVCFGSHPLFPIAAERCLTELLQGFDPANKNDAETCMVSMFDGDIFPFVNVSNHHTNGRGHFSKAFFYGTPSYEHTPFPDRSGMDNEALFQYCMDLALSLSDDVLIRDVSYLGFNAYCIVVPGVSYVPADRLCVSLISSGEALAMLRHNVYELNEKTKKLLLMGCNRWEASSLRTDIGVPVWRLKIALLLSMGNDKEVLDEISRSYAWNISDEDKKELLALSEVLILRADHSTPSEIERYIKMFYPEEILSRLKENWLCDSPLDRLVSGISTINESYDYEKINELRLRLKKVFTENRILQDDLKKLFNR